PLAQSSPFPYTTLFRSAGGSSREGPRRSRATPLAGREGLRDGTVHSVGARMHDRRRAALGAIRPDAGGAAPGLWERRVEAPLRGDRKSTRLNSSHDQIS